MADLPELSYPILGIGEPTPYLSADIELTDGTRLSLSQYRSEYPDWGVDSFIKANGFPVFVHGAGVRSCIVHGIDSAIRDALNGYIEDQGWKS